MEIFVVGCKWKSLFYESEEPFDRRSAFIDLLVMTSDIEQIAHPGRTRCKVNRGQIAISLRELAERWNWSKGRVSGFLDFIERLGWIKKESNNQYTLITVVDYDQYTATADRVSKTESSIILEV